METTTSLSPETAEILESLTFIETECLAAWQNSAKTVKELGLLREARACLQMKIKLLGIGAPKTAPESEPIRPEPLTPPATAEAAAASETPKEALAKAFRGQYQPEYFRRLDPAARASALRRFGLTEAEAKEIGY